MLFLSHYRSHTPTNVIYEISGKKIKKMARQKWLPDAEACKNTAGSKSDLQLTSQNDGGSIVLPILSFLAIIAFVCSLPYGWSSLCKRISPTQDLFQPHILQPCSWINLNTTENNSLYFAHYKVEVMVTPTNPCDNGTDLLIIVHSNPEHLNARNAIRDTWATIREGRHLGLKCQVLFLLGDILNLKRKTQKVIVQEIHMHSDMIITNVIDEYANLSLKSTVMLHWVLTYCPNIKYLMKTDDDAYVNKQNLATFVRDLPFKNNSIYGHMIKKRLPHRHPMDQWYISRAMYPENRYPNFVAGNSYMMTSDVIQPLCTKAVATPFFIFEDIFLTGICAEKAGIKLIHQPGISKINPDTYCLMKKYITLSYIKPYRMRYFGRKITEGLDDCEESVTEENLSG